MAKAPDPLVEYICDQLAGWSPVAARRLFGGWGFYRDGIMFGLTSRDTIYFRTDEGNRKDFETAGMEPFRYRMPNGKTVDMAYHQVPPEVLEDGEELARWADKASHSARRAAQAKKAKSKPRPSPVSGHPPRRSKDGPSPARTPRK
jgi:DNA transformation protein